MIQHLISVAIVNYTRHIKTWMFDTFFYMFIFNYWDLFGFGNDNARRQF